MSVCVSVSVSIGGGGGGGVGVGVDVLWTFESLPYSSSYMPWIFSVRGRGVGTF